MKIHWTKLTAAVLLAALWGVAAAQVPSELLNNLSPEQIDQLRQLPAGDLDKLRQMAPADLETLKSNTLRSLPQPQNVLSGHASTKTAYSQGQEAAQQQIEGRVKGAGARSNLSESPIEKSIDTTNTPPKQFGYDLFEGEATTFAPVTDIPITEDYLIGPGDTVIVTYIGSRNEQYPLLVNREGQVTLPGIGLVVVAGKTFEAMSRQLIDTIDKQMIGVKASITMGSLRSIRVFILGEATRPGSYTVSALSTLTNALFVSGGVKNIGSLRNIELRRTNKLIQKLDLYDLLMRGDTKDDVRLQPGDVIFIPKIGSTATVIGEVLRPAIYELKTEKSAQDLLDLAGGLLPGAYPKASQLARIDAHKQKTIVDADLTTANGKATSVVAGDVLRVYSVRDKLEDVVLQTGHFVRPGGTQWRAGMRVSDLVTGYEDLLPKPDMHYALIKRELEPDRHIQVLSVDLLAAMMHKGTAVDVELQARDELIVFPAEAVRTDLVDPLLKELRAQARRNDPAKIVTVNGFVRFPGTYPYEEGMPVARLLTAAADDRPRADLTQALLARTDPMTQAVSTYLLDLSQGEQAKYKLQAGDELYIFNLDNDTQLTGADMATPAAKAEVGVNKITGPFTPTGNTADGVVSGRGTMGNQPRHTTMINPTDDALTFGRPNVNGKDTQAENVPEQNVQDRISRQVMLRPLLAKLRAQARSGDPAPVLSISGSVVAPGEYPLTDGMRVSQLVALAGKFREDAYVMEGELTRVTLNGGKIREVFHQPIDIGAILRGDTSKDLALQPYDNVVIRPIPGWTETVSVSVTGRVRFPGTYVIRRGEKLSELVRRAGGFLDDADPNAAVFTRVALKAKETSENERLLQRIDSEMTAQAFRSNNAVQYSTTTAAVGTNGGTNAGMLEYLSKRLRTFQPVGRLSIELPEILAGSGAQDVSLENGDRLVVPPVQESVSVIGEVNAQTSLRFDRSLSLKDYVENAGGATQNADKDGIYVIHSNGRIAVRKSYGWMASNIGIQAGDTIVVPMDVQQIAPITLWSSVSQIFSNVAIAAAAMKTVGVLP